MSPPPLLSLDFLWYFLRRLVQNLKWGFGLPLGLSLVFAYWLYQRKAAQPTYYTATLTFVSSEERASKQSMVNALLGGMVETFSETNSSLKIEELILTRKFFQIVLFTPVQLSEGYDKPHQDYLINHYLYLFRYNANPQALKDTKNYFFFAQDTTPLDQRKFSRNEGRILLSIYNEMIKFYFNRLASPSGIITLSYQSTHEEFAALLLETMFERLDAYYTEKTVLKQRKLYEATCERRDKLRGDMKSLEAQYYNYLDSRQASAVSEVTVRKYGLQKELMTTMETYFMAVKNAEAAGFSLDQQTPVLQSIDVPMFPLPATPPNPLLHGVIGAVLGLILGLILLSTLTLGLIFLRKT